MSSKEYGLVVEEAKQNILGAQMKQKKYYDLKNSKPGKFKVNALYLKLDFKRKKKKGSKLKDRFVRPYKIFNCLPHGVYKVQDSKGIKIRATGSHLKIFHLTSQLPFQTVAKQDLLMIVLLKRIV